ncbi:hypothetical protein RCL1_001176 [Eukaryota sp. TZLM3-RCL]
MKSILLNLNMKLFYLLLLVSLVFSKDVLLEQLCSLPHSIATVNTHSYKADVLLHPCRIQPSAPECSGRCCIRFDDSKTWLRIGNSTDRYYIDNEGHPTLFLTGGDYCFTDMSHHSEYFTRISFQCNTKLKRGTSKVIASTPFPTVPCSAYGPTHWSFIWFANVDFLCNSDVSVGLWIFFILVFGILGYLIGGISYKAFVQGVTGIELIPNIDFWTDIVSVIKSFIKKDESYTGINVDPLLDGVEFDD